MPSKAMLLADRMDTEESHAAIVLDFFGIPWQRLDPAISGGSGQVPADRDYGVIASMALAARIHAEGAWESTWLPLLRRADSMFLFGGDPSSSTQTLLRRVTGSSEAAFSPVRREQMLCRVFDGPGSICGPLNGLEVHVPVWDTELALSGLSGSSSQPLISTTEGSLFAVADLDGTPCYLASCPRIIDLSRSVEKGYFDIADYFSSAVPLVAYLRHAFGQVMFASPENGACLIIDDPALRAKYGFVNLPRLAALAADHRFTSNIALIPWNWWRSHSSAVDVFRRQSARMSLSMHGCDHSAREFGAASPAALNVLAKLAGSRMEKHRRRTGLDHDPVMVFPQGVFSTAAAAVLKYNGFMAAVNTEVSPIDQTARTDVGSVWSTAILKYADFPIYTRRYTFHGLHNFAFDLLLGKPCLLVTHHGDFRNDASEVVSFIDRLNTLPVRLTWRTLADVLRRAYQRQQLADGTLRIRMYGNEIALENSDSTSRYILVEKPEHAPETVDRIEATGASIPFLADRGILRFSLRLNAGETELIRVFYKDPYGDPNPPRPLSRQLKLAARRYLSELRDETQARAPWVYRCAQRMRKPG